MKNIILIVSSIAFSLLFFQNNLGINIFIFSLITTGLLAYFNPSKIKTKKIVIINIVYITTSIMVFFNHNFLSVFTHIISFFMFVGSFSESKTSIYIELLNGIYTTVSSSFVKHFNNLTNEVNQVKKQEINYIYWFKIIGIPIVVLTIFIILYRKANPVFDNLISRIDLSFINLQWLLFSGLGYYLLLNITNSQKIEPLTTKDLETTNLLLKSTLKKVSENELKNENQLGLILMVLLNILIVFLLITDVFYLSNNINRLADINLSIQVHKGINALITSIVLAIALIIYFFRGNLNFYNNNLNLKKATYTWISLNIILVFITLFKNYLYVFYFGFTYKRIGVFIYLFLAVSGLIFTYLKIKNVKNITYLFRKNIELSFVILVIASFINWDVFITNHNIKHVDVEKIDVNYLISLKNNAYILKNLEDKQEYSFLQMFSNSIYSKYTDYSREISNNSWQEYIWENIKTN